MERFGVNWLTVKLSLCTGASGMVIGAYLLVKEFGYVDPVRVQRLVADASEAAVVASLARRCAEEFRSLPDTGKRMVALMASRDARRTHDVVPVELVTRPGAKKADYRLAEACEALLLQDEEGLDKQLAPNA
ncbi:hypothetical protein V1277_005645 [Bradyrhizobium sp. AZCC 1588]|uniref:hypothetical protein n=1 Tax=unclassified Bradyrhizobium TaxID=2631580 RepID=UPI002FF25117